MTGVYRRLRDVVVLGSLFVVLMNQSLILTRLAARGALSERVWTGLSVIVTGAWFGVMAVGAIGISIAVVKLWGVLND